MPAPPCASQITVSGTGARTSLKPCHIHLNISPPLSSFFATLFLLYICVLLKFYVEVSMESMLLFSLSTILFFFFFILILNICDYGLNCVTTIPELNVNNQISIFKKYKV